MILNSIFQSVNGEVNVHGIGSITTFVRLACCNLRCKYCDTEYAQTATDGYEVNSKHLIDDIVALGSRRVTITGGEPLLQKDELEPFVNKLVLQDITVVMETNGSFLIPAEWPCTFIADYKLENSGMTEYMSLDNFKNMNYSDFIKFVIGNRQDYEQARDVEEQLRDQNIAPYTRRAYSPIFKDLEPKELLTWLLQDGKTGAYLNVQMHKIIKVR